MCGVWKPPSVTVFICHLRPAELVKTKLSVTNIICTHIYNGLISLMYSLLIKSHVLFRLISVTRSTFPIVYTYYCLLVYTIYTHTYIYIHTHVCIFIYICIHIHAHIHTHTCIYIHLYSYTYILICLQLTNLYFIHESSKSSIFNFLAQQFR